MRKKGLMNRNQTKTRCSLGYYTVFTDGTKTEENYFNGFKESLPLKLKNNIEIKVIKTKTKDLIKQVKTYEQFNPQKTKNWIVFDKDQVKDFDTIIKNAKEADIDVGWSNPCIEIWFYAYFGDMPNCFDSTKCLEKFKIKYEKQTGEYYIKNNKKIYELLNKYGNEKNAIEIAKNKLKNVKGLKPSEICPATTIHNLIEEINCIKKNEK